MNTQWLTSPSSVCRVIEQISPESFPRMPADSAWITQHMYRVVIGDEERRNTSWHMRFGCGSARGFRTQLRRRATVGEGSEASGCNEESAESRVLCDESGPFRSLLGAGSILELEPAMIMGILLVRPAREIAPGPEFGPVGNLFQLKSVTSTQSVERCRRGLCSTERPRPLCVGPSFRSARSPDRVWG